MKNNVFINEFLTCGLQEYFSNSKAFSFEKHIIECLANIYGSTELKTLFEAGNESGFQDLIKKYGIKPEIYDNFLRDTVRYEQFKVEHAQILTAKSDIPSIIEVEIITMFLQKCLIEPPVLEEISRFENNLLNDFSVIKMHFDVSINPNRTRDFWNKKKKILSDDVQLIEIKPNYLDDFTYERYGINANDVKKMDYRMVEELNRYIKVKLDKDMEQTKPNKFKFTANTAISSGSGFVDALMVISIIVTELSIGLIYLFLHL